MKMKLLADVHISPITVAQLQKAGYEINRITDYLPANASDIEIIDFALQKEAFIITQDLDFSAIIAQSGIRQPSVISLRVGDAKPQVISKILKTVLPLVEKDLVSGAIISVEETKFRIRKLPI
jgi:predicted nuclease of predicted toxin-antitoxin system